MERVAISYLIYAPRAEANDAVIALTSDMFYTDVYKKIFSVFQDGYERYNLPIVSNKAIFIDSLQREFPPDRAQEIYDIYTKCEMEEPPQPDYFKQVVVPRLSEFDFKRKMRKLAKRMDDLSRSTIEVHDVKAEISAKHSELMEHTTAYEEPDTKTLAMGVLESLDGEVINNKLEIKTGIDQLDNVVTPLNEGDLVTIVGHTGAGKSHFAVQLARNFIAQGYGVFLASLEMNQKQVMKRLILNMTGVDYIRNRNLDSEDIKKITDACSIIHDSEISIKHANLTDFNMLVHAIKHQKKVMKCDVVLIDHLHHINFSSVGKDIKGEYEQINHIVKRLKVLADELEIAIVLFSQVNKPSAYAEVKPPRITDLRGTHSIAELSTKIISIHPEGYGESSALNIRNMDVNVMKQRNGATGSVGLTINYARSVIY
jgi:replicative DNA helicase